MVFSIYGQAPAFLKLRAGTFFRDVIANYRAAANITQMSAKQKKVYLYGSHDTMVSHIHTEYSELLNNRNEILNLD